MSIGDPFKKLDASVFSKSSSSINDSLTRPLDVCLNGYITMTGDTSFCVCVLD